MAITVQWLNHATFKITNAITVYIDPWKLTESPQDGDIVLVSHSHYDHFSADDIAKAATPQAQLIGSADVIDELGQGQPLLPGQTVELVPIKVSGVPAYNPDKEFHPVANKWLGFIIEIDGKRIYYAGDTDEIPEMADLGDIDLALLPVGGTYTMTAAEAAAALQKFKPAQAVPYHWGDIVGSHDDAVAFEASAPCDVHVLHPGQSVTL